MFIPIYFKRKKYLIKTYITTRCQRRRDSDHFPQEDYAITRSFPG